MNKAIILLQRPVGTTNLSDFKIIIEDMPSIDDGEVLLKTHYVSVDPYLRGRMNDSESYIPPFELNKPLKSGIIAEVTHSNHSLFKVGDFVLGNLDWKEYQVSNGKDLRAIPKDPAYLTAYLGILGMTGLTAYLGLTKIGLPEPGKTLVVSGAAGAVGSIVGQVGKLLGCHVVGLAGSDKKVELITSKFGFDEAINYKTTADLSKAIKAACPDGVDIYFDNVGGELSDSVLANINKHARIPLCGAISLYNSSTPELGPYIQPVLVKKSALIQGFIVGDFADEFPAAITQLTTWLIEGKLTYHETIYDGFDQIPQAFLDLFKGLNEGKMIVKV